jgi:hypothetical protein
MAPNVNVCSQSVREGKSFCAPSRNRTGDLLLMRPGWYHKTSASASLSGHAEEYKITATHICSQMNLLPI